MVKFLIFWRKKHKMNELIYSVLKIICIIITSKIFAVLLFILLLLISAVWLQEIKDELRKNFKFNLKFII